MSGNATVKRMRRSTTLADRADDLLQGGIVVVQTHYNNSDKECPIQLTVLDSGPGIHYTQQERIFQLDTSTREQGHGLGLYISQNLIEAMGGQLHLLDSIIFAGSLFAIGLPDPSRKETGQ